jgi:hypothetical protein
MWLTVWIVSRTSILDPKIPANRQTGCHGHAMQFLAVGHKIQISFLRNAEQIQKNSDKIQKNLYLVEENLGEIQMKFR